MAGRINYLGVLIIFTTRLNTCAVDCAQRNSYSIGLFSVNESFPSVEPCSFGTVEKKMFILKKVVGKGDQDL